MVLSGVSSFSRFPDRKFFWCFIVLYSCGSLVYNDSIFYVDLSSLFFIAFPFFFPFYSVRTIVSRYSYRVECACRVIITYCFLTHRFTKTSHLWQSGNDRFLPWFLITILFSFPISMDLLWDVKLRPPPQLQYLTNPQSSIPGSKLSRSSPKSSRNVTKFGLKNVQKGFTNLVREKKSVFYEKSKRTKIQNILQKLL